MQTSSIPASPHIASTNRTKECSLPSSTCRIPDTSGRSVSSVDRRRVVMLCDCSASDGRRRSSPRGPWVCNGQYSGREFVLVEEAMGEDFPSERDVRKEIARNGSGVCGWKRK